MTTQLAGEVLAFDCTQLPTMEAKAIEIANRIAGKRGHPPSLPDPVQVLEDADALLRAGIADYERIARQSWPYPRG